MALEIALDDQAVPPEHVHGDIELRWEQAARIDDGTLGMCRCCCGPCKVSSFDDRGVGFGPMLCSRCVESAA